MENQPAPGENFLNTTLLMTTSAGFVGLIGVAVSLFPEELLRSLGTQSEGVPVLLIRLVGALYLSFAVLNWMARDNLTGWLVTTSSEGSIADPSLWETSPTSSQPASC